MKVRHLYFDLVVFVAAILAVGLPCLAKYSGGTGEPGDPYRIATAADLNDVGNHFEDFNSHFVMVNDVNLSAYTGSQFNVIGSSPESPFAGVFDGNDHTICNFRYSTTDGPGGLFGHISGPNAVISDLGIIDSHLEAFSSGGTLAFSLDEGKVFNCFVENGIVLGQGGVGVGGLIYQNSGTIWRCSAAGIIAGRRSGGLVADNSGYISECFSTGEAYSVVGLGGLCHLNSGTIMNCYSAVDCEGVGFDGKHIAGLVAENGGLVANCYSVGEVQGWRIGGLIYDNSGGTVVSSFWDVDTSFVPISAGEPNAVGGRYRLQVCRVWADITVGPVSRTILIGSLRRRI